MFHILFAQTFGAELKLWHSGSFQSILPFSNASILPSAAYLYTLIPGKYPLLPARTSVPPSLFEPLRIIRHRLHDFVPSTDGTIDNSGSCIRVTGNP